MLTRAELDEIRRQVRQRRHLSWATLDKLIDHAIAAATPKPEPKIDPWIAAGGWPPLPPPRIREVAVKDGRVTIEPKPEPAIKNLFARHEHEFRSPNGAEYELCIHCFSSKEEAARPDARCIPPFTYRMAGAR